MGVTGEFLGQADGIYYFSMEDVREDATEYDVLVKLDAAAYRAGTVSSVDDAHRYNSDPMAKLPVIDLEQDAMSVQKESYTENAVADFLVEHAPETEDNIRGNMSRTITVSVDSNRVNVEYKYAYQRAGRISEYVKQQLCYDRMETGNELRSVYLYYYPLYRSGIIRDEIIFENNEQLPVDFYLMKQKHDSATVSDENGYRMKLSIVENGVEPDVMKTRLHTNLGTNLLSGSQMVSTANNVSFNGHSVDLSSISSLDILDREGEDRMFDIEVSIYEKGAKSAGYPEEMRLTTLEGSKLY